MDINSFNNIVNKRIFKLASMSNKSEFNQSFKYKGITYNINKITNSGTPEGWCYHVSIDLPNFNDTEYKVGPRTDIESIKHRAEKIIDSHTREN